MEAMLSRTISRFVVLLAGFGLVVSALSGSAQSDANKRGRKYKSPPPTARIEVTILRDFNGKPIENAAVIFHPMVGEKDEGNMELKTNEDGKTIIDVLPIGDTVRLQVIARGYQTYGEDYKIEKADMAIEIKMKRPGEQYSIYKMHDASEVGGKSPDADKKPDPATGTTPPKDAPPAATPAPNSSDGSAAKQPDAQSTPKPAQPPPN
jgi:hypothetical protein